MYPDRTSHERLNGACRISCLKKASPAIRQINLQNLIRRQLGDWALNAFEAENPVIPM